MKQLKPNLEKWIVITAGAAALTAILMSLEFNLLEANFYDVRMTTGPQPKPSSDIVLITIDNQTTQTLEEIAPLSLDSHARLLETLEKAEPRAVGYAIDMNRVSENNPELIKSDWSSRFVDAAKRMESRGSPVLLGTLFDVTGEVLPPYPLSQLSHAIALIHKDGNVFAEDKITRRALTYLYDRPVFHMELARSVGIITSGHRPRGSFYVPQADAQYVFFRYHGSSAEIPYPRYSFIDVLNGNIPAETFRGKIVLVGTMIREDAGDYSFTPYSKTAFINPKIAVHANILDTIIQDDGIGRLPPWVNAVVTFVMIGLVLAWVLVSKPLTGVFSTLGLGLLFCLVAQILFIKGIWLRASQPLVGIFLGYYLVVPYRLIREYRKRWDYQRQNELLVQVEELKTNFLSLVTHDLKTPVARIQGLAEVLIRKASDRLIDRDRETVNSIIHATDELNRFITSILELNKVESNRLKLSLESKDVNQLLERAIESFRPAARARQIKINANLEPLFPIRVDSNLISKVINNLIDNALKYSPAGSEILIESKETSDRVVVSITDRGIGMTEDEKKNLFTRFYRAKNDTTSQVSGTGLGLYLTKYFIEAHRGSVEVQSEPGQGSTFRILLPLDQPATLEVEAPGLTRTARIFKPIIKFVAKKKESSHV